MHGQSQCMRATIRHVVTGPRQHQPTCLGSDREVHWRTATAGAPRATAANAGRRLVGRETPQWTERLDVKCALLVSARVAARVSTTCATSPERSVAAAAGADDRKSARNPAAMSGAANLSQRVWNGRGLIVFVSPSGVTVRSCCHCRMQHRRILAKPPSRLELGDAEPVLVEWQHANSRSQASIGAPVAPCRRSSLSRRGARASSRAQLIVDALGVTTRYTPARQVRRFIRSMSTGSAYPTTRRPVGATSPRLWLPGPPSRLSSAMRRWQINAGEVFGLCCAGDIGRCGEDQPEIMQSLLS